MNSQLKSSVLLLVFLGVLFSIPVVAKTWSAHGAVPAVATGLLVMVAVFLGPISYFVASTVELSFVSTASMTSNFQLILISVVGVALFFVWIKLLARGPGSSIPYLPVTGWALMGASFCVLLVFTHTT